MKSIIKTSLIILFASCLSFAQLTQVTSPNMYSEVPIYKNARGEQYASVIVFKYKNKLIELPKGIFSFKKENITNTPFKELLNNLESKYGEFTITKVVPNAEWGDSIKTNKRTKQRIKVIDLSQIYKIQFDKPVPTDSVCVLIKSFSNIEYAEGPIIAYLTLTPNDPEYTGDYLWSFNAIKAEQAWNLTTGSSNIRIGMNDQFGGVSTVHEDLVGKVAWNNLNSNYGGHGIVTSGVAGAATNNNLGIASLGWNVSLLLDYRWGSSSAVASVQELVDDRGADVINFSWVSSYSSQLANVIQYALQNGVVCVAAAGNDEWTIPGTRYPAAYNFGTDGQVIAVSGTQLTSGVEQFITGFNYSPGTNPISDPTNAFIDFAAPGSNYRALSDVSSTGYIHIWAGTSISAPFVSALVGLMLSVNSSLTPNQIYDILQRTSEKIGQYSYDTNGWNRYLGYGRIDAEDAVNAASGAPAKPKNLHFTYSNSEHPSLGWDANTESNISGYRIYREYDKSGTWSSAGYVSHPTTTFIDYVVDYTKPIWAKTVRYRVKAVNSSLQYSVYSNMIETTGIMADPNIVASDKNEKEKMAIENFVFALDQNYPNPFNPNTSISFSLPQKSFTSLKVFDILGKEVKVLVNDLLSEGNYSFNFDGNNLSSGLYIYQLSTNMGIVSRKMLLMK